MIDRRSLPREPGCYIYKDKQGTIIYIGKAKNIKKRVNSYFSKQQSGKTAHLVARIADMEFIITPSEVEALLLEAQLIAKHKPKYNIDLKHNVRYAWIVLTDEPFPRLLSTRKKTIKGEYFGPFVDGQLRRTLVRELQKKFFIRTCRVLPKKECLRYHIGICKAPCILKQTKEDYATNVDKLRRCLQGKNKDVILELTEQMQDHAENLRFEQAKVCKEQIESLVYLQEQLLVQRERAYEEDVIHYLHQENTVLFQVFSYRNGVLAQKQSFSVPFMQDFFDEFLKRYYSFSSPPKSIILPHLPEDESIASWLASKCSFTPKLIVPKQGIKKKLLDLAMQNLLAQQTADTRLAGEFQEKLELDAPVYTLETFDISHHAGKQMVASMVQFRNGSPVKKNYRRYQIKTVVDTIDDFRAMKEVVTRRYSKVLRGEILPPDLIVVDGGRIQVDFAKKALDELGLSIPLIGLAKKFEEVYFPEQPEPVRFDKNSPMMRTLIQSRDEAHRFAITYHRLKKTKALIDEKL